MDESSNLASIHEMLGSIVKTFAIAHENDSDEHLAQALVYNAGRLAWRMREQGVEVSQKTSLSDVVTDADQAAESFVSGVLALLRPDDGILGEEGAQASSKSGKTWVIDPVDGTYNFTCGSDYWCSALALVSGDPEAPEELHFGAVHRPAMGYTWFGGKNIPTTRDGQAVARLDNRPAQELCLATYLHPTFVADSEILETWAQVTKHFASTRMLGAASVDLGGIADGSLGLWMQHSVLPWDWLPGLALVEGAGGVGEKVEAAGKLWCVAGNAQAVAETLQWFRA